MGLDEELNEMKRKRAAGKSKFTRKLNSFGTARDQEAPCVLLDGNMREFPSFKDDYERLIVPTFGQDPYALRQCLSGKALHSIKGL
ncbi:uncharacterized protein LOC143026760 [Oratosquilla oratoria]|uniref:uncharacterized protein LOC143026760 n=1 Tax=Oratosquilla oratoria TaxID=337810 RepID=UPI003F76ED52